jgi:hypothetical protein
MEDPTMPEKRTAPVAVRALDWIAKSSARKIIQVREAQMQKIEECAAELRHSGACDRWLESCDDCARQVVRDINGPLLEVLLSDLNYHDMECLELLQTGATF